MKLEAKFLELNENYTKMEEFSKTLENDRIIKLESSLQRFEKENLYLKLNLFLN